MHCNHKNRDNTSQAQHSPVHPHHPMQGTNASHLAQCLGLDASRYGHSSSGSTSLAAALRDEALQVTGSLLDDDTHYSRCDPFTLTSSNATSWEFGGVRAAIK
jgi:DNA polymerase alpha subunit A